MGQYLANWFTLLVGGALVLAEAALGLRLFLKLTSANSANGFVEFIYDLTGGMIRPFTGALSDQTIVKGGIFEPSVVIAMVVFFIGAMLAIWVVRSLATLRSWGGRLIYR